MPVGRLEGAEEDQPAFGRLNGQDAGDALAGSGEASGSRGDPRDVVAHCHELRIK